MKLSFERRSLIAIILLLGVVLGVVGWNAFRLLSDFDRLERQSVGADALRMQKAIEEELSRVSIFAGDYAAWDDTYAYLETHDETYITSNYPAASMENLHIDYVLFYDMQGNLVKGLYRQPDASEIQDIPPADLAVIESHGRYLNPPDLFSSRGGFLVMPDGPAAFASRAVVTSLLEGPIRGTLIMGRKLDQARLDGIASDLLFEIYLVDEGAPEMKARFGTPSRFSGVTVLSGQRIAGVVRIPDLGNTDSFTVAFNRPRSIYASGTSATILFLGVIAIIGAAALAIMRLLLRRLARALKSEQTSAEYFRLLAKNSREMVLFASYPDLQIIEANQAVLDICGVSREEMERKRITDLGEVPWDLTNPAMWERINCEGAVFEGRMWRNNAAHLPVEVAVEAADANGAKIYTLLMRGISDRVEHERMVVGLNQISNALRTTISIQESVPILLRHVLEMFQAEGAALVLWQERVNRFQLYQAVGEWETVTGLDLTRVSGMMQDYFRKRPVVTTGVARFFLNNVPGFTLPFEVHQVGAVRIVNQGGLIGVMVVGRSQPFTQPDELLLEALSDQAASTLHRAALFEQTREYARQIEAVAAVGRKLAEILELEEIHSRLADGFLSTFDGLDNVSIWQFNQDTGIVKQALSLRYDGSPMAVSNPDPTPEILEVLRSQKTRLLGGSLGEPAPLTNGTTLILPVVRNELVMAVLEIHSFDVNLFTAEKMDLMTLVASSAGIAYENALLYGEVEKRLSQLQSLREIDAAIVSSFESDTVLRVLLEQFRKQLNVEAAVIWLPAEGNRHFVAAQAAGLDVKQVEGWQVETEGSLAGRSLRENQVLTISGDSAEEEWLHANGFCCGYAAPMIARGAALGTVEVFSREGINPDVDWYRTFETLARQGAVAISTLDMFKDLQRKNRDLVEAYNATIEGWARALDMRDHETRGHSLRVTELTVDLARFIGVPEGELEHLRRGALLHDIGKMGIADSILLKAGSLDDKEWETMRLHPVLAAEFLKNINFLQNALDIPLYHHEWWNGSGYPRGLRGEEIPLAARIFAVVDVWDALNSDRPYRLAWPEDAVLPYIMTQSGSHFDPMVVDAFVKFLASRK